MYLYIDRLTDIHIATHTHTHTYIYTYITINNKYGFMGVKLGRLTVAINFLPSYQ